MHNWWFLSNNIFFDQRPLPYTKVRSFMIKTSTFLIRFEHISRSIGPTELSDPDSGVESRGQSKYAREN